VAGKKGQPRCVLGWTIRWDETTHQGEESTMTKSFCTLLAALTLLQLPLDTVKAEQSFPSKPIKIVVPYPPGGAADITTRIYANAISEILGQPVVIDNKPGGGTNIAAEFVARSAPDGYTLYVSNFASHAVNRHLFKKLPFDPVKDFTHVAMMMTSPMFLCLKPGSPFKTAGELAEFGRANPGKLTYGSTGYGSPPHLSGEQLKALGKFDAVHVPYRGAAEEVADLLAGQLDFAFDASAIAHHRAGRLKCIATTTTERWPTAMDLPPVAETVPGYSLLSFFGIVGPANVPTDVVQKLNDAFVTVAKKPETKDKLNVTGVVAFPANLKETQEFMLDADKRWEALVKASGAKVD